MFSQTNKQIFFSKYILQIPKTKHFQTKTSNNTIVKPKNTTKI